MSCPDMTADLALPALDLRDRSAWVARARRVAPLALVAGVLVIALLALGGPLETFADALRRAVSADARWVAAAAAFEIVSFAGYIVLLWHVGSRFTPNIDIRLSYQITLAGAAATRLLPTGGAGGVALTLWALRGAGLRGAMAGRALLAFLVVLYSVFLAAIVVAGASMAGEGPTPLTVLPAAAAGTGILAALVLGLRRRPAPVTGDGRVARVRRGARVLGDGVRDALAIVRGADARLLGAPVWWACDVAVLYCVFEALGAPPALGIVVLGYFVGQVANTLPVPGAVSGGMVGVLLAFGVAPDLAIASVLSYRAVALWLPAPAGAAALVGLRKRAARVPRRDAAAPVMA